MTHTLKKITSLGLLLFCSAVAFAQDPKDTASRLLSAEGKVEVARAGQAAWSAGVPNQTLQFGDRIRTGVRSRATFRLSDLSVVVVKELATVEVRPAQTPGANSGFEQKSGSSYFFNRERPGTVEFRTPQASGAIRGTEFHLTVAENGRTELALFDGAVELTNDLGGVSLASGEQAVVDPGQPPRKTAMLEARSIIQWMLYYPAILDVDELGLSDGERNALSGSLAAYRVGDLLAAQEKYPDNRQPASDAEKLYRAATLLAVGQVGQATQLVQNISSPLAGALRQMVETVLGRPHSRGNSLALAGEWMAESYALQAQSKLDAALDAARQAAAKSPQFGFAWARVAELEFSFGHAEAAKAALGKALALAPRNAQAHALNGFAYAAKGNFSAAEKSFNDAIALDPALGNGWLGRGLVRIRQGRGTEGRQDLQVAAAREPQRSLLRSYLGKAWSQTRDVQRAEKELGLAKKFDPRDPTPWLYAAILDEQQNRVNDAVSDLEKSQELNDNRSVFRSRLLLDQDKAVRGANLARLYQDVGMLDWSLREASRAVSYDYGNFSAHQFLANSYDALRDPKAGNLRYEAPAVSEYFLASLLSPVGATPLSQAVSQQEYTRLFERNHAGVASSTEYFSSGDWVQQGSVYGNYGSMDFSLDSSYVTQQGQRKNNDLERMDFAGKFRQQLTPQDTLYFEVQRTELEAGDVLQHYRQTDADRYIRVHEIQEPNVFIGYHHEWSPGNHTLALVSRVDDSFKDRYRALGIEVFRDAEGKLLYAPELRRFGVRYQSDVVAYSAELQQILKLDQHTFVFGGRFQTAASDAKDHTVFRGHFPGADVYPTTNHLSDGTIHRTSLYLYDQWELLPSVHLSGGVTSDRLSYPDKQDLAPVSDGKSDREQLSPKAGFIWTPWADTALRGAYTRSLGGVFFDNSLRLEPTEVAGFNQTFRSLAPESVAGNVPGTRFETFGLALEQKFPTRTYLTFAAEELESEARQNVGAYARDSDTVLARVTSTPAKVQYRESSLSVSLNQLVAENWSFGVRYKLTEANFKYRYAEVPLRFSSTTIFDIATDSTALLHQVQTYAAFNHSCGFFSEFTTVWTAQNNHGDIASQQGDDFWQLNIFAGYRFWQRHAEVRLGVLNLTDRDYQLSPVSFYAELPRERTFYANFKFYF